METYTRGKSYLVEVTSGHKAWTAIFECRICLSHVEFAKNAVTSGHTKTCGCRNGKRTLVVNITREGYVLSSGGINMVSKVAKGYLGYNKEYLHRLVATKFIPNPDNLSDVNHIDGNKHNNDVSNLEWCTRSHNIAHAWKHGLNKGVTGQISKKRLMSDADIIHIRTSTLAAKRIGIDYSVSKTTILNIRAYKIYKEIKT